MHGHHLFFFFFSRHGTADVDADAPAPLGVGALRKQRTLRKGSGSTESMLQTLSTSDGKFRPFYRLGPLSLV